MAVTKPLYTEVILGVLKCDDMLEDAIDIRSAMFALSESSAVARRAKSNLLFGESTPPICYPSLPLAERLSRLMVIDVTRVSHRIVNIKYTECPENHELVITGDVLPMGERGNTIDFNNGKFHPRMLVTRSNNINGVTMRNVEEFITFDFCPGDY